MRDHFVTGGSGFVGRTLSTALVARGVWCVWRVAILGVLARSPLHVAAIRRALGNISEKVLAEQLRALERAGVARHGDRGPPTPVMYEMTPHGHTLCDVVASMAAWGAGHRERTSDHHL